MSDLIDHPRDDAPPASSKRESEAAAAARNDLGKGDTLVAQSVTINRPVAELFAFWRNFSNLASVMENVERVDVLNDTHSHWVVKAPGGKTVEWNAVITDERENESIAWASEKDADVPNSGRVTFRHAGGRGTVVTATILYDPPAGFIGKVVAKMFQREPAIQARRDLRRFKQLMETGEIATGARNRRLFEEGKN
ncbi:MAG: SRPBCC family protein [Proteobacteria bacterium]|nr:SRPBCC family protein [Pseudomonadota bacterium]